MTYDALGVPVRVTQPDGTYTEHHYGIVGDLVYDDVLDANRHRKQYCTGPRPSDEGTKGDQQPRRGDVRHRVGIRQAGPVIWSRYPGGNSGEAGE